MGGEKRYTKICDVHFNKISYTKIYLLDFIEGYSPSFFACNKGCSVARIERTFT